MQKLWASGARLSQVAAATPGERHIFWQHNREHEIMLKPFDVCQKPLTERTCHVRVKGQENANWLLARLSTADVTRTSTTIQPEFDSVVYTFEMLYPPQDSHIMREELVESFPSVQLRMGFGMSPKRTETTPPSE